MLIAHKAVGTSLWEVQALFKVLVLKCDGSSPHGDEPSIHGVLHAKTFGSYWPADRTEATDTGISASWWLGFTVAAFSFFSPACFLFNPDSCLPSLSVVTGGCSTVLEPVTLFLCGAWSLPIMRAGWHYTMNNESYVGGLPLLPTKSSPYLLMGMSVCMVLTCLGVLYCFLLSASVGAQFPHTC